MKTTLRALCALLLTTALTGCAGGWRGGAVPAAWDDAAPAAATAPAAKAKPSGKATAVTADGVQFVFAGEASSVNVAGEFNSWSTSADPLAKQANGTWTLTKALAPGKYAYKFVVNGGDWKSDENAPEFVDDGYGGKNSVVVIGAAAAPAAPPAAAAAIAPAASGDGVTFRYKGTGGTVHVAGEFNSWSTSADPLKKQADGTWTLTKALAPGKYAYKFVVDGTNWKQDDGAAEFVDDGYGGKNSVVVVGGTAAPAAPAAAAAAAPAASGDGVTFRYKGTGGTVHVAGEFNSWSTSADPMKKQADGTWTLTKALAPGKYAYKFVVDGTNWKQDDGAAEFVDDGYGGKNSVVVVGGTAAPAAPAAAAAAAPAASGDGVTFRYKGTGGTVHVAGEFNSWSTSADPMKKQADGTWTLTKALAPGKYAYKFVVDGTNWKQDDGAAEFVDDGYGGKNSVVVVGGTAAAGTAAAAAKPAAAATKPLAAGAKPKAPQLTAAGVVFTFAGAARTSVSVCGDFNSWGVTVNKMTQQADGTWTATVKLPAGSHAYKFLVDGATWKQDEGNPASADDGFGGKNSIIVVK